MMQNDPNAPIIIKNDVAPVRPLSTGQSPEERLRLALRNPIFWAIAIFAIFVIVLICISLPRIFHENIYGENETRIDNIGSYIHDLPLETRDNLFTALYDRIALELGSEDNVPRSGAMLREDTLVYEYDEATDIHHGTFIVDIAELQQSYFAQFEWSADTSNPNLSSYKVVYTCPSQDQQIYSSFVCKTANDTIASDSDSATILGNNTPYEDTVESGLAFITYLRYYMNGDPYVEANINSCGNAAIISETHNKVAAWLTKLGLSESSVPIQVRDLCDGES